MLDNTPRPEDVAYRRAWRQFYFDVSGRQLTSREIKNEMDTLLGIEMKKIQGS